MFRIITWCFFVASWAPLFFLIVGLRGAAKAEGFAAIGFGPLFEAVVIGSVVLGILGVALLVYAYRRGTIPKVLVVSTLVSSGPAVWFFARVLLRDMTRSSSGG